MTLRRCIRAAAAGAVLLACALHAGGASGATGVTVALTPSQQVTPGATFDLFIEVTKAGDLFNGFDAVIGFDPAALTLVPLSPLSLQEGTYMAGACGNTFHRFRQGAGTDTITDVLMCSGIALPGPGQLYRLRFRASTTPQRTLVRFLPGLRFYNAGVVDTNAIVSTNVPIGIGMPPLADVEISPPPALSLRITPNPSPGALVFTMESARGGPVTLAVLDVQGRLVRRFTGDRSAPGVHTVTWDGRDEAGARLPAGVYLVRLEIAGSVAWGRATLIR